LKENTKILKELYKLFAEDIFTEFIFATLTRFDFRKFF